MIQSLFDHVCDLMRLNRIEKRRTMKCQNCAANMTLMEEKNYFFCNFCGGFHFPEENSEGLVVLQDAVDDLSCPVCKTGMSLASIADHRLLHCTNCRGVYIANTTFRQIVDALRAESNGPGTPRPIDQKEYERDVNCPACERRMETHPYYGPGAVVIDSCSACHMIWLDHGELKIVVDASSQKRI